MNGAFVLGGKKRGVNYGRNLLPFYVLLLDLAGQGKAC